MNILAKLFFLRELACQLRVLEGSGEFPQNQINYQAAPFGFYPYGRQIFGNSVVEESLGCSSFELPASDNSLPNFVLLKEGSCSAKMKAKNTMRANGALLIIYKNMDPLDDELLNVNDLPTQQITIPVIIISNADGLKLSELIRNNKVRKLQLKIPYKQRGELVQLDYYFKLEDKFLYQLMKQSFEYFRDLKKLVRI